MIQIRALTLPPDVPETVLKTLCAETLRIPEADVRSLRIRRRSIDARKKDRIVLVYTVDVAIPGDENALLRRLQDARVSLAADRPYRLPAPRPAPQTRPVVIGFGPAGIFSALLLSEAGLRPIVLERGYDVHTRRKLVEQFFRNGTLDEACNVQFGEGGAGTFSDGKLTTGIHDERISFVLQAFHEAGAPEEILYDAKPHIGTDVLFRVVLNLRKRIERLGGEVRFGTAVTGFSEQDGRLCALRTLCKGREETLPCELAVLAIGHSARDTFAALLEQGVRMEPKAFSMGVRIEHLQKTINEAQYGKRGASRLPAADYKLNVRLPDGSSAYTFCMCPGGEVVAAASERGGVVTNGMSRAARDGENANAALLVTLTPEDFPGKDALAGVRYQRELEQTAFRVGGGDYRAPAQLVGDFLDGRPSTAFGTVRPTYCPGVTLCDLHDVLPVRITSVLEQALPRLSAFLHGFNQKDAVLTAPETRSSSPVRILRDERRQANVWGLFPCGEGAGYAGGIMSAAVDGLVCAEALIAELDQKTELPQA